MKLNKLNASSYIATAMKTSKEEQGKHSVLDPTVRKITKPRMLTPTQDEETLKAVNILLNMMAEPADHNNNTQLQLSEVPSNGPAPLEDIIKDISEHVQEEKKLMRKRQDSILIKPLPRKRTARKRKIREELEDPSNQMSNPTEVNTQKKPGRPRKTKNQKAEEKTQEQPSQLPNLLKAPKPKKAPPKSKIPKVPPKPKAPPKPKPPKEDKPPKKPRKSKAPSKLNSPQKDKPPKKPRKPRSSKIQKEEKETQTEDTPIQLPQLNTDPYIGESRTIRRKITEKERNILNTFKKKHQKIITERLTRKHEEEATRRKTIQIIVEISNTV